MAAWIYKGGQQYFKSGLRGSGSTIGKTVSYYLVDFSATMAAGVGNNTASHNGIFRGVLNGAALTSTAVQMAAVYGSYNITTSNASTWPKAGVIGELHDGSNGADGAVVAVCWSGNSATPTNANALFTGVTMGSTAGLTLNYGLDFGSGTGVTNVFNKADLRLTNNVVVFSAAGVPTNGASGTGNGFAGPGSIYVNISTGIPYCNTNTKASPTWTKISGT